jgi:hypothetical protein
MRRYLLVAFMVIFANIIVSNANAFSLFGSKLDGYWVPNMEQIMSLNDMILDGQIDIGSSDPTDFLESLNSPFREILQQVIAS